ncbi:MAG: hypothetical protein MZW92_65705 [Comamonadaceae bacterium]|nr:hypothetical protein [Comamonadaceae bacterium]
MMAEDDFHGFEPVFFTTSQVGQKRPEGRHRDPTAQGRLRRQGTQDRGHHRHLPGRRPHQGGLSQARERPAGRATGSMHPRPCA